MASKQYEIKINLTTRVSLPKSVVYDDMGWIREELIEIALLGVLDDIRDGVFKEGFGSIGSVSVVEINQEQ